MSDVHFVNLIQDLQVTYEKWWSTLEKVIAEIDAHESYGEQTYAITQALEIFQEASEDLQDVALESVERLKASHSDGFYLTP